jgi:hypothetical protein
MNKLVINTQYMENYGTTEKPYMKFKGGNTYIMENCGDLDENETATIAAKVRPYITTDLIRSNGGSEEYVTEFKVVGQRIKVCEDWESPITFHIVGDKINFMKVTDNREDGWMKREILEKTETWTHDQMGYSRLNYKVSYLMEDGDICNTESELREWFEIKEVA